MSNASTRTPQVTFCAKCQVRAFETEHTALPAANTICLSTHDTLETFLTFDSVVRFLLNSCIVVGDVQVLLRFGGQVFD